MACRPALGGIHGRVPVCKLRNGEAVCGSTFSVAVISAFVAGIHRLSRYDPDHPSLTGKE